MPRKNLFLLLALAAFLTISIYLYSSIDNGPRQFEEEEFAKLRVKYERLQSLANENDLKLVELKKQVEELESIRNELNDSEKGKKAKEEEEDEEQKKVQIAPEVHKDADDEEVEMPPGHGNRIAHVHEVLQRTSPIPSDVCQLRLNHSSSQSDLQMLDLYNQWSFDNADGGVWKQGWPITYDAEKVKGEPKLEVVVIPHSHCDPGWIKTFEDYYQSQTKNILSGMAKHLGIKEGFKFIYAEVSFFERWWRDQNDATRDKVKEYIKSGSFELVTGGWVMTDEANAHYHSMVVELMEGHEWILNHLGQEARPKSHWSIDPFGLSPSLPHLLSAANITDAALQRVHYVVKRELARKQHLEFHWRQLFGSHGHPDVRSHIFPFYSYDVPHTCGPEPKICCQFDFRRLPAGGKSCDWGVPPKLITPSNVAQRASMLYDQYRKKSQLYKTNALLIPLGDDFRYDIDFEWDEQYKNYKMLFDYMNQKPEWNVHARFGTLSDYFGTLGSALKASGESLPTLSGDFFTYSDRDDHYWSGYFTSRPFYKQMDRVLQHWLRAAEIAFTLGSIEDDGVVENELFNRLVSARRALSLFQHHDAVTGTAKDDVVTDYGQQMLDALKACEAVLSEALTVILGVDSVQKMRMDEKRDAQDALPQRRVYAMGQNVVVFNTLTRQREEPICIHVESADAVVEPIDKEQMEQQIAPVIQLTATGDLQPVKGVFELCFKVVLGSLEAASYRIVASSAKSTATKAAISGKNNVDAIGFSFATSSGEVSLENEKLTADFDPTTGMLKKIDGPLVKRVLVSANKDLKILQTYSVYKGLPFVDVDTEVDVREKSNFELGLRFGTNVQSGEDLFTDLNGLQMIRRQRQKKLPLQANFYPMATGAFIEDQSTRFTVHVAQPLGVASHQSGEIEIMLDRRLQSDDGRGLFQGVVDNKRTVSHVRLLVEPMSQGGYDAKARVAFHSAVGHLASWTLHYPIVRMVSEATPKSVKSSAFEDSLHCDLHLVTLRTLVGGSEYGAAERRASPKREAAMVLHRVIPDCRSQLSLPNVECSTKSFKVEPIQLMPTLKNVFNASLTLLYEGDKVKSFELQPQDVKTVKITW